LFLFFDQAKKRKAHQSEYTALILAEGDLTDHREVTKKRKEKLESD
jgi:hypothetical protein